jgi:hypothetical protein
MASGRPSSTFALVAGNRPATIVVDRADAEVVRIAAQMLADDVARVSGVRPKVGDVVASPQGPVVVAGTLGKSAPIDRLAKAGKLRDLRRIEGRWEATLSQIVERPFPGVGRALVVVGSDRRGTAYGLTRLSERIGASPWTWWADVPAPRKKTVVLEVPKPETDAPAVKYRGIFINDEDWGLHRWASRTFEPETGSIGPKTYRKVFELMLRLRLNYLWPAMHGCTREFHLIPENIELAHRYGIVAGASHCEPMLYNNDKWDERRLGKWDYTLNRERIYSTWEHEAKTRGDKEAVWTMGIRGIHDRGMQGPPDTATRLGIVSEAFRDQTALLDHYVTDAWGPVAKCFVPYKEVLPLYDAGLEVPEDVTIVWVDDNFGYIRRLGAPKERTRPGGAGVYWHLSYYGFPHSYTWINTTAPALMWEEFQKAWANDARNLWVVNVGDLKPMEIGIDYFSRLAWNPGAMGPDSQPRFLRSFAARQFSEERADRVADLLGRFYRLGTRRKPELMNREWATGLSNEDAKALRREYRALLDEETEVAATIPESARDAFYELIGFPARVLGASGQVFMADRDVQFGTSPTEAEVAGWRAYLERQVAHYNGIARGKWNRIMPGLVTGSNLTAWNSQVRWPWGEKPGTSPAKPENLNYAWQDAATARRVGSSRVAKWTTVLGLGPSGRATALWPAGLKSSWREDDRDAPALAFDFQTNGTAGDLLIDFLPTFRIYPGMQLRVAVTVDEGAAQVVEVPGSSGKEDENGPNRRNGVQNNFVRARVPLPTLSAGRHTLKIRAVDPGVVIDRVGLPRP